MFYYFVIPLSLLIFAVATMISLYLTWRPKKKKVHIKSSYLFIGGVFLSAFILFLPSSTNYSDHIVISWLSSALAAIHTSIRLFVVDFDFETINSVAATIAPELRNIYTLWGTVLIVLSPMLTAGAALSFLVNISARNKYLCGFFKDAYIFSELNDFSISLAQSLKTNDHKRLIVFTDVYDKQEEESSELMERAKQLDAIIFKKDITAINFRTHSKKKKLYFFILGSNHEENLNQTVSLTAKYDPKGKRSAKDIQSRMNLGYDYDRGDTRLYLFTSSASSEMLFRTLNTEYIKIRRINDKQSMIYQLLHDHGMQIFTSAKETGQVVPNSVSKTDDPEKQISALIIGLGSYGTEMLRSLVWFGQMHPYRLNITAFDSRPNAASVFRSEYPELFDFDPLNPKDTERKNCGEKFHNGDFETVGEAHYGITIHPNIDVTTYEFDRLVAEYKDTTYAFVSLGDDDINIRVATKLRIIFRRLGIEPVIHTVLYNPIKEKMFLEDLQKGSDPNKKKSCLCIQPFGSISYRYSEECILNSTIELAALKRHMKYTYKTIQHDGLVGKEKENAIREGEESFWNNDYNYRSSIASALHFQFKKALNIPGIKKDPDKRTEDERTFCAIMEHQRWNAYVRSEGYVKADSRDKLVKTHHLLVPFDELPYSEQRKDDD